MTTDGQADDERATALDAYLAQREADGYVVETRSGLQAVICRRHRLYFVLKLFGRGNAQSRLVVSVDQHGEVTSVPAEPVRW
jgi:hypothetical protein